MSKKKEVIRELFLLCKNEGRYEFNNDDVKKIASKIGFSNPFDVTKIDSKEKLPKELVDCDYGIIHLGEGRHMFVKGLRNIYHEFEPIESEFDWKYQKSILNEYNTSESNILSVANNQRILHHFIYNINHDKGVYERAKTYFPHRTKANLSYWQGETHIELRRIQIEIDLTIEYDGDIYVFEAKSGNPKSFAVYQIYHPFLYYHSARESSKISGYIRNIYGVYVIRRIIKGYTNIFIWMYSFKNPLDPTSIYLIKSARYRLISDENWY